MHFKMLVNEIESGSPLCFLFLDIRRSYCLRHDNLCQWLRILFQGSKLRVAFVFIAFYHYSFCIYLKFTFVVRSTNDKFHRHSTEILFE